MKRGTCWSRQRSLGPADGMGPTEIFGAARRESRLTAAFRPRTGLAIGTVALGLLLPSVALAGLYLNFGRAERVTEHVSYLEAKSLASHPQFSNVKYYRPKRQACARRDARTIYCDAYVTATYTNPGSYLSQNVGCTSLVRVHLFASPIGRAHGRWTRGRPHCAQLSSGYARDGGTARSTAASGVLSAIDRSARSGRG
jgi:hypothetical protein